MSFKDESGIELISLQDLVEEPIPKDLDGSTLKIVAERAVVQRWPGSNTPKLNATAGLQRIKFWVILDCGEKGRRFKPILQGNIYNESRPDRYIMVSVGEDQDVRDVELEERGNALPGEYYTFDEAVQAVMDLNAVCRITEE